MTVRFLPEGFKLDETRVGPRCFAEVRVDADEDLNIALKCVRLKDHDVIFWENEVVYHLAGFRVEGKPPTRYIAW